MNTVDDAIVLRKALSNCGLAAPESLETLSVHYIEYARQIIRIVAERGCPAPIKKAAGK